MPMTRRSLLARLGAACVYAMLPLTAGIRMARASSPARPYRLSLIEQLQGADFRHDFLTRQLAKRFSLSLKAARIHQGLTCQQLGEKLDWHADIIEDLESGDWLSEFSINELLQVAKALDIALNVEFVPVSEVLRGISAPQQVPIPLKEDRAAIEAWVNE